MCDHYDAYYEALESKKMVKKAPMRTFYHLKEDFCCKGVFVMEDEGFPGAGFFDVDFNGKCPKCNKQWEIGHGIATTRLTEKQTATFLKQLKCTK